MKIEISWELIILRLLAGFLFAYAMFGNSIGFWVLLIVDVLTLLWVYGTFILNGGII